MFRSSSERDGGKAETRPRGTVILKVCNEADKVIIRPSPPFHLKSHLVKMKRSNKTIVAQRFNSI